MRRFTAVPASVASLSVASLSVASRSAASRSAASRSAASRSAANLSLVCVLTSALLAGGCTAGSGGIRIGTNTGTPPISAGADPLAQGIALFNQGRYAEAEQQLRGAYGLEAQAYLAASIAKQGRFAEAEGLASAVLDAAPTHPIAVAALGESLVGQGKHAQAINRMTRALELDGSLAYAYYWRGQAYSQTKRVDKMVADFEAFLRLAPNAPEAPAVRQLLESVGRG